MDTELPLSFARINQDLLSQEDEHDAAQRIVDLAVETVPHCQYAGISLRAGKGKVQTPASTHEIVILVDSIQQDLQQGPCLTAIDQHGATLINTTDQDRHWPQWSSKVARLGIHSVLSVHMSTPDESIVGSLNLYSSTTEAFGADDVALATVYAHHAATAMEKAHQLTGLRSALQTRHIIGVAQGILMQRFGLDIDESFRLLVRFSRDNNTKLRDVAAELAQARGIDAQP